MNVKLALVALAATAMLALTVGTAGARNLRATERTFEITWTSLEFDASGTRVLCPVTFLGRFEEFTIAKSVGSRIGRMLNARVQNPCTGGSATFLNETFPWNVSYQAFGGTLPSITSLTFLLIGLSVRVHDEALGAECLAVTTAEHPGALIATVSSGALTSLRDDETREIPLGGGLACSLAGNADLAGTARITNLPGTATLTVTLI